MKLLYVHEHLSCKDYISDFHVGFVTREAKAGDDLPKEDIFYNYMYFIEEGEMNITTDDFSHQLCMAGEMVFIPCNTNITAFTKTGVKYLVMSFNNNPAMCDQIPMEELIKYRPEKRYFNKLDVRTSMQLLLKSLKFYIDNKIMCKHLHLSKQQEIFINLRTFYTREELAQFLCPILEQEVDFKSFILKNYQEVKTVEELARLCHSSVRSLTRKFRIHFGDSPYSWILKQRSLHIKARLADPKVTFADIVKEFGFSSPAHFTSYCKKYFGESPSRFRKKMIAEKVS